jgi:hypothetical protein
MLRVRTAVAVGEGFQLRLQLTDGTERVVDVSALLSGPIFDPLRSNRDLFEAVTVDPVFGTVVWPNGADIDPDVLLLNRKPASAEIDVAR